MFYIVETQEQIDQIISYDGNENVFIDIIPIDDRIHPCLNKPSLIYFRPLSAKRGFMICIDHIESFSLSYDHVMNILIARIPQIYTIDAKTLLHYGFKEQPVNGLKMAYTLNPNYPEFPDSSKFDTQAHKFYYSRLRNRQDVNRFIPISKHYEKYENLFNSLIINEEDCKGDVYNIYNDLTAHAFYRIEQTGIGIDKEKFDKKYGGFHKEFSIKNDRIFSIYNFYNHTARPSCTFNGFNFLGLKKDESREVLVPKNDIFVEYDFRSYQVKLLANFLWYKFPEPDIHSHLMKLYGEEDYDTAKRLTFKYLYGRSEDPPDIPFFKEVYEFRDYLWQTYQEQGYITSPMGRKIFGITEITQILPYFMQAIETEANIHIIYNITALLTRYKTKLVLYTYDAFLFDLSYEDDPKLLQHIERYLSDTGCDYKISYGESYGDLGLVPSCT